MGDPYRKRPMMSQEPSMGDPYRERLMMSQEPSMGNPYRKRSMTHGYEYKNCDGDCSPLLKLTVPDYVCGSLLGRGGSQLKEFISQNGGNIRISNPGDRYPGTDERKDCTHRQ